MNDHLIFYDADCKLCHQAVDHLSKIDDDKRLLFAPLEGETAVEILIGPNARYARANSLVLVESFRSDRRRFWIRSQAAFRIYWVLGSYWIGWLSFLPAWMTDWIYRWVAHHRHYLRFGWKHPSFKSDRFLS